MNFFEDKVYIKYYHNGHFAVFYPAIKYNNVYNGNYIHINYLYESHQDVNEDFNRLGDQIENCVIKVNNNIKQLNMSKKKFLSNKDEIIAGLLL